MHKALTKKYLAATAAFLFILATLGAFWLGEHPRRTFLSGYEILIGIVFAIAAGLLLLNRGRNIARNAAIFLALVYCFAFMAGVKEANLAFNDCVDNGEQAREELAKFHAIHGRYPSDLAELCVKLPGQLILPPNTLNYARTPTGYKMYFGDWLVTHEATESDSFFAHK